MLTSATEAEDIVQDVWLRWQSCDRSTVRDPTAFLVTTTTRMCINELQSAHARREPILGRGFPNPSIPARIPRSELNAPKRCSSPR